MADAHQSDDTGSDAELLDNWDVVDTDEAADASLYFSQAEEMKSEHKMSEEQVEEAPELEDFVPQVEVQDDDSLIDSDNIDKACSDSDDGVSVISESGPEEEVAPIVDEQQSLPCEEQELLQLGEKGEPQYKHSPNPELNLLLNAILVVAVACVSGLAIGHFLGVQEECYAPPLEPEAWKELNSLNLENDLLKMQLKQLQDSLANKKTSWIEEQAPGNIYEEQMKPLEKWAPGQDTAPVTPEVLQLAAFTLNATAAPPAAAIPSPAAAASPPPPEVPKANTQKRPDSFFGRVEAELEAVMRRVGGHGALEKTAGSVRRLAHQVRAQTATGSSYALEQLKKGVARAVHGLKKAAAHLKGRQNDTRPQKQAQWRPQESDQKWRPQESGQKWRPQEIGQKWRPKEAEWRSQQYKQQQWRPKQHWKGDDDKWRQKRQQFQQNKNFKNFKPQNNKWRR